ncbi:hypothetical protein JCM1841_001828 [Sporobolomyces salmonicolor]
MNHMQLFAPSEPSSAASGLSAGVPALDSSQPRPADFPSKELPAPRSTRRKRSHSDGNQRHKPPPVCAMCKAKKTRCDRLQPCFNCVARSSPCTYGVVGPEHKIPLPNAMDASAAENATSSRHPIPAAHFPPPRSRATQVKDNDPEVSPLLHRVEDLAVKLRSPGQALLIYYRQASDELDKTKAELVQPGENTSVAPALSTEMVPMKAEAKESTTIAATLETKKPHTDWSSPIDDETAPPSTTRRPTRPTRPPCAPLSAPPPTRSKVLPPPLPAFDSSGRLPSPIDYHFPPGYRRRRRSLTDDDPFEEELGPAFDSC